jgi:hypothetical protein
MGWEKRMEVLLRGSAINSLLDTISLYGYQVSGSDGNYKLHLQTQEGDLTIQPIETLSSVERQAVETLLSQKLSRTRTR